MQGGECVAGHKGGHCVPRLAIKGRVEVPDVYTGLSLPGACLALCRLLEGGAAAPPCGHATSKRDATPPAGVIALLSQEPS